MFKSKKLVSSPSLSQNPVVPSTKPPGIQPPQSKLDRRKAVVDNTPLVQRQRESTREKKTLQLDQQTTSSSASSLQSKRNAKRGEPRFTCPGQLSEISAASFQLLPSLTSDTLAPLHIVLPIALPFAKIIVAENSLNSTGDYSFHHYYFKQQFPSARNLFSRLHGFCNQNPAWLVLDIGYIACREHQVAPVVDAFLNYFKASFEALQAAASPASRSSNDNESQSERMERIRLRCSGLRLRNDQGTGWYLYETPVEVCTAKDETNFKNLIKMIETFNDHLRSMRLCQYAAMKPFIDEKFAIVVLKQEGVNVSVQELQRMDRYQCEGIEISEVRLVRHKLLDRFGSSMFEVRYHQVSYLSPQRDPRFPDFEVYGRPIACNRSKTHGRFVFARAPLPSVVKRPVHKVHPLMHDMEKDSDEEEEEEYGD